MGFFFFNLRKFHQKMQMQDMEHIQITLLPPQHPNCKIILVKVISPRFLAPLHLHFLMKIFKNLDFYILYCAFLG